MIAQFGFTKHPDNGYGKRTDLTGHDHESGDARFGVRRHNRVSGFFRRTVTVSAKDRADGDREKAFRLNKNSLVKWMNERLPEEEHVSKKTAKAEVIERLRNLLVG